MSTVCIGQKTALLRTTNRWGGLDGGREVTHFGWVEDSLWHRLQDYQTPVTVPLPTKPAWLTDDGWMDWAMKTSAGLEVARKMALPPRPTTIWEFSAYEDDPLHLLRLRDAPEYIRMIAVFGDVHAPLVRWSWVDREILYPVLLCVAKLWNRFLRQRPE